MTQEQFLALMAFLESKDMTIAGYKYQLLLGTEELCPLHPDDYLNVFNDFKKEK